MRQAATPFEVSRAVSDAIAGSQAAFAWLYRTFAPLVHSIHLGMATPARADELTQDTFAIAFARLHSLRETHRFGPWIAVIARRNFPKNYRQEEPVIDDRQYVSDIAGPDESAQAEHVLRAIQALPEAYRDTLMMRLVEGMSGPEIAALTGLTPQSVRVNLHRGMAKLRLALGLACVHEEKIYVPAP